MLRRERVPARGRHYRHTPRDRRRANSGAENMGTDSKPVQCAWWGRTTRADGVAVGAVVPTRGGEPRHLPRMLRRAARRDCRPFAAVRPVCDLARGGPIRPNRAQRVTGVGPRRLSGRGRGRLGTGGGDRRAWILLAALVALPVATK